MNVVKKKNEIKERKKRDNKKWSIYEGSLVTNQKKNKIINPRIDKKNSKEI